MARRRSSKICRACAERGEKVYLRTTRRSMSMVAKVCPKCGKTVIINRK